MTTVFSPISHVLLDIEGTTCPVDYVTTTLFPYASKGVTDFLERQREDPETLLLLEEIVSAWGDDPSEEARELLQKKPEDKLAAATTYIRWLIRNDRKLTPLKTLQGKIWDEGYRSGDLVAPIFEDVAPTLKTWHDQGISINSYSSGSVHAQKLLYRYSTSGDISSLISHWFDTTVGSKQNPASYETICRIMGAIPASVLFISDATAELAAADQAGLQVRFSQRPGNPEPSGGDFKTITTLQTIFLQS